MGSLHSRSSSLSTFKLDMKALFMWNFAMRISQYPCYVRTPFTTECTAGLKAFSEDDEGKIKQWRITNTEKIPYRAMERKIGKLFKENEIYRCILCDEEKENEPVIYLKYENVCKRNEMFWKRTIIEDEHKNYNAFNTKFYNLLQ